MMILRMLIWITMMRRGVKRRVQTKVKSVAGFGQKHEERVDLGMRNMRKGKAAMVVWAKQAQAALIAGQRNNQNMENGKVLGREDAFGLFEPK